MNFRGGCRRTANNWLLVYNDSFVSSRHLQLFMFHQLCSAQKCEIGTAESKYPTATHKHDSEGKNYKNYIYKRLRIVAKRIRRDAYDNDCCQRHNPSYAKHARPHFDVQNISADWHDRAKYIFRFNRNRETPISNAEKSIPFYPFFAIFLPRAVTYISPYAKGLCRAHWSRFARSGDLNLRDRGRPWTPGEDAILMDLPTTRNGRRAEDFTVTDLAADLGRTRAAVTSRRHKLLAGLIKF